MKRRSETAEIRRDWTKILYSAANLVVKAAGCVIFAVLLWYVMRYTWFVNPGDREIPLEVPDSVWKNLLGLLCAGAVVGAVYLWEKRADYLTRYRICTVMLLIAMIWIGSWSFWWICSADRLPQGDQAYVYGAASYFREGNFYFFGTGGYLGMFPYQMGLVFLIELLFLFVGAYNYFAFEVICALMAVGIVYLGYKIVQRILDSMTALVCYCIAMMGCVPLVLYTSWVYGDLPSIFFTLLAFDFLLKYEENKKTGNLAGVVVSTVFAMLVRQNSLIFVIALVLAGSIEVLKRKDKRLLITLLLTLLLPGLVYKGIYKFYEVRSGAAYSKGIPYVATVSMGLQESEYGSGWYNNHNKKLYQNSDFDRELTAVMAKQEIRLRFSELAHNRSYTTLFFKRKILSQWNEPLYQSVYFNTNYESSSRPPKEGSLADSVCNWNFSKILALADRLQFVVYFGTFCYFAFGIGKKSRLLQQVLVITILGGFFFSIIWEAKARYVFPYFVIMFPMAAIGYARTAQTIEKMLGRTKNKQSDNIIKFRKIA